MEKNNEHYRLSDGKKCKELLSKYPDYKVYWRSGFEYRGAGEQEMPRDRTDYPVLQYFRNLKHRMIYVTFEEAMQRKYDWSADIDIDVDHEKKELHFNGFSENDMY